MKILAAKLNKDLEFKNIAGGRSIQELRYSPRDVAFAVGVFDLDSLAYIY